MKRLILSLLMTAGLLTWFTACSSNDKPAPDPEEVKLPVTGLKVPASVQAGSSFLLGGENFPIDSKVLLQDKKTSTRQNLSWKKVSGGLECSVAEETIPGLYELFLASGKNEWKLSGSLKVEEAVKEMPVIGLKVPASVEAGQAFTLQGAGFPNDSKIFLVKDQTRLELTVEPNPAGLVCQVEKTVEPGMYQIFLASEKYEWELTQKDALLEVLQAPVVRKVVSIRLYSADYQMNLRNVEFTYDEKGQLVKISDPESVSDTYDRFFQLTYTKDLFAGENTEKMYNSDFQAFHFDLKDGRVIKSSFTVYKDKVSEPVEWIYNEEGQCTDLDKDIAANLIFDNAKEKNNPNGLDVAKLIYFLTRPNFQGKTNLALIYAVAQGLTGKIYPVLPVSFIFKVQNEQGGLNDVQIPISSYVRDADGFVTKVSYQDATMGKLDILIQYL